MTDILARQRQLIGTTAEWGADDLVLGNGEIAVERVSSTEIKIKIGDGVNKFSALPYVAGGTTGGSGLQLTGGTLTGPLVLPAGAPTGRQAVSKEEADKLYVNVAGDTLTGPLVLPAGVPTGLQAVSRGEADKLYVNVAGDTLTGPLVLPAGAPTGLQALAKDEADKLYVLVSKLLAASAGAASAGSVPKLNAAGKIDASFLSIPGGMTFKGTIDPTAAAPATPAAGDYYFASKQATLGATWTGLAGTHIKANDSLLYDGTNWHTGAAVADLDSFVSKAGDTMTGKLIVPDVAVSGGTIDGTAIGGTTRAAGAFTTLDASGRLLIGSTSSNSAFGGNLQVEGTSGAFSSFVRYSTSAAGAPGLYLARSKGATVGTNTIVASGDTLGNLIFSGANGTGYSDAASISAFVDGTPGASADMPGRLTFSTTADGASNPTERMRIDSVGNVGIGATAPKATLDVNGSINCEANLTAGGYIEGKEQTAPATPTANGYRIYAEDNGSGKTRLMVKFATGPAQQIAIEP